MDQLEKRIEILEGRIEATTATMQLMQVSSQHTDLTLDAALEALCTALDVAGICDYAAGKLLVEGVMVDHKFIQPHSTVKLAASSDALIAAGEKATQQLQRVMALEAAYAEQFQTADEEFFEEAVEQAEILAKLEERFSPQTSPVDMEPDDAQDNPADAEPADTSPGLPSTQDFVIPNDCVDKEEELKTQMFQFILLSVDSGLITHKDAALLRRLLQNFAVRNPVSMSSDVLLRFKAPAFDDFSDAFDPAQTLLETFFFAALEHTPKAALLFSLEMCLYAAACGDTSLAVAVVMQPFVDTWEHLLDNKPEMLPVSVDPRAVASEMATYMRQVATRVDGDASVPPLDFAKLFGK